MIAIALALLLQATPTPKHADDVLPFSHALMWATVPKAADLWTTAYCLDHNPRCAEANPIQRSAEQRAAIAASVTVVAAFAFYEFENHPRIRKHGVWRRVPRYAWALLHLGIAAHNLRQARKGT